jgi:hypothetical protein
MTRHHIDFQADLHEVAAALADADFVDTPADDTLKTVELKDGIGTLREVDGRCHIDLLDEGEGGEASRLVETLRAAGYSIEHQADENQA